MAEPTYGSVTEELYGWQRPLAYADSTYDYPHKRLCATLAEPLQLVDDLVRGVGDRPGWSVVFDADACPDVFLPWLGQLVGVRLPKVVSADQQRARIKDSSGFKRGTRDSLIGAARTALVPSMPPNPAYVHLTERTTSAYALTMNVRTAETPDSAAVLRAVNEVLPAGLVLTLIVSTSTTWNELSGTWDAQSVTWDNL